MSKRREAGNSVMTLLLLLAILGGAGYWNCRRKPSKMQPQCAEL